MGQFQGAESDALKAFRVRLREVEAEIKEERHRSDDGKAEWVQKTVALRRQLEALQEVSIRLDQQYKVRRLGLGLFEGWGWLSRVRLGLCVLIRRGVVIPECLRRVGELRTKHLWH